VEDIAALLCDHALFNQELGQRGVFFGKSANQYSADPTAGVRVSVQI
jgi:hypothetical protein